MPIIDPLNDAECLGKLIDKARSFATTARAQELAQECQTPEGVAELLRQLRQRDDLGDPDDGPRIACEVSQRLRLPTLDPNCFERAALYLAIVSILDPARLLTAATLSFNGALHTFPVEIENGIPRAVVLDPAVAEITPAMSATAWQLRNTSPMAEDAIAPWFHQVAETACIAHGAEDCYHTAMDALRNSLVTGEPITHPEELACVLELTAVDVELYGARGRVAFDRVCRSLRNFSLSLDIGVVQDVLNAVAEAGGPYVGDAIRAALIAKFGPAAQIALENKKLSLTEPSDERHTDDDDEKPTREERRERVRRMSLAFRPRKET